VVVVTPRPVSPKARRDPEPRRVAGLRLLARVVYRRLVAWVPDRIYLAVRYRWRFGAWPDYKHPRHFNEFTHLHMLTSRDPLMKTVADKYLVREHIAEHAGPQYLVPSLGVWERAEDVPLDELPTPLVLKDTLGNERNVFIRDRSRFNAEAVRTVLTEWQRDPFWARQREWAYRDGQSRIIAEVLLDDGSGSLPLDYKLYTIGGRVQFIQVDRGRFHEHTRNLYSPAWELLPVRLSKRHHPADPKPSCLEEMLAVAERLSRPFAFLRVDFYWVRGQLYVGELTNYSGAGFETFDPPSFSLQLGEAWRAALVQAPTSTLGNTADAVSPPQAGPDSR
jgi:hypothetical protein